VNAPQGFEIIYENGPVLGVVKPAGVATQAPAPFESLETRIKDYLREREGKTGNLYLAVPHRLDRPVSGAMVFARHVRAARKISTQFEERRVKKTYWALVAGAVTPERATWTDHLRKVYGHPQAEVVPADHPEGREAVLHYEVRGQGRSPSGEVISWLQVHLETGRTHQVRIQAASRGWQILGDELYGSQIPFGPVVVEPREHAIALHARSLALLHPMTQVPIELVAPVPGYWNELAAGISDATTPYHWQ
jgi:23S rRNA pseudouridine1911/1915/1917 synthase